MSTTCTRLQSRRPTFLHVNPGRFHLPSRPRHDSARQIGTVYHTDHQSHALGAVWQRCRRCCNSTSVCQEATPTRSNTLPEDLVPNSQRGPTSPPASRSGPAEDAPWQPSQAVDEAPKPNVVEGEPILCLAALPLSSSQWAKSQRRCKPSIGRLWYVVLTLTPSSHSLIY